MRKSTMTFITHNIVSISTYGKCVVGSILQAKKGMYGSYELAEWFSFGEKPIGVEVIP